MPREQVNFGVHKAAPRDCHRRGHGTEGVASMQANRTCAACGAPLAPNTGEKPSHFARRRTCGRVCSSSLPKRGDRYRIEDRGYESPCWIWQKYIAPNGYGQVRVSTKSHQAHRWHWEQLHGPVPKGLELDHLCRVRACVNPEHLEPVTREVNQRRGANARLTEAQVSEIKASPLGYRKLAARYGVARATIRAIRVGRTWRDVA